MILLIGLLVSQSVFSQEPKALKYNLDITRNQPFNVVTTTSSYSAGHSETIFRLPHGVVNQNATGEKQAIKFLGESHALSFTEQGTRNRSTFSMTLSEDNDFLMHVMNRECGGSFVYGQKGLPSGSITLNMNNVCTINATFEFIN